MKRLAFAALAVVLVSSVALADKDKDKDNKGNEKGRGPAASGSPAMGVASGVPAASASGMPATSASGKPADDDDDDAIAADGGKPVAGRRSPAQLTFRKEVWERREKALESKVHKGGKRITDEEREAIKKHYLVVSRLMRIRELAQEDKADAIIKRADAALEKEEKSFDAKLEKLNAKTGAK